MTSLFVGFVKILVKCFCVEWLNGDRLLGFRMDTVMLSQYLMLELILADLLMIQ